MLRRISAWLIVVLLCAAPSWAAISHDATSTSAQTNVQNPSYTHTRGATCANPIAVIKLTYQDSTPGTISSVTYGGTGATQVGTTQDTIAAGNKEFVNIWRVVGVASGGATVQANFSEVMNDVQISTSTYCGVDQTTPFGTAAGTSNVGSTTVTVDVTSAANELVVDAAVISGTRTITVGAGQTERTNVQSNHRHVASDEPGAATTTMSWTISSLQSWAQVAAPLKPAASATSSGTLMLLGVGQ